MLIGANRIKVLYVPPTELTAERHYLTLCAGYVVLKANFVAAPAKKQK
jgi:hypothetical protein